MILPLLVTLLVATVSPTCAFHMGSRVGSTRLLAVEEEKTFQPSSIIRQKDLITSILLPLAIAAGTTAPVPSSSRIIVQPANAITTVKPQQRDVLKGKEIFAANCNGCHNGGNNSIATSKTLKKDALEKYVALDEDKLETWWRQSFHKGSIASKITDEGISDVLGYVVDQARNDKW